MKKVEIKHFKVLSLGNSLEPNSVYYVLETEINRVKVYITDFSGIPIPIVDLVGEGVVKSVTGTAVTGTLSNPQINISNFISSELGNLIKLSNQDGKLKVNKIVSEDSSIEITESQETLNIQLSEILIEKINNALQPEDISQYTDEQAQDAVGLILESSPTIEFNYDDALPKISAEVIDNSITLSKLDSNLNNSVSLANSSVQPIEIQNFFSKTLDTTDDITEGINKFSTVLEKNFWNAKQENLVSGVNIKTINGNSILGSGDLSITFDVSGKEDIANKQNSLAVDATNLKYPTVTAVNSGLATKVSTTATNNFIPKVNAGGNLENSIISQPVANRVDVAGAINISTSNLISFGGFTGLFPAIGKLSNANALIALKADGSDFVPLGYSQGNATLGFRTNNVGSYGFTNSGGNPLQAGTVDTAISRLSAGRFAFGNGVSGNTTGQVIASKGLFGTSTDDGVNVGIFNGTISVATATQPTQAPRFEQVVNTSTNQTNIFGSKTFVSNNTNLGGIGISNTRTGGIGLEIISTVGRGVNVDASGGVGARFYAGTTATEALVVTKSDATTGLLLTDLAGTDTGDFIKVNGQSTGGQFTFLNRFGVASARAGTDNNNLATVGQIKSRDGWASYSTTTYTNASPFTVAPNTTVTLPNNANNSITSDLPLGVTAFYNGTTNKITPVAVGDAYTVNVRFKARTTMNNDYLTLFIDIGAGTQINAEAKQFLKGANTEQPFSFTMPIFTLATFVANGGEIKVVSNGGTISIYDVTFYINRNYTRQ